MLAFAQEVIQLDARCGELLPKINLARKQRAMRGVEQEAGSGNRCESTVALMGFDAKRARPAGLVTTVVVN